MKKIFKNRGLVLLGFGIFVFLTVAISGSLSASAQSFTPPWGAGGQNADVDFVTLVLVTLQKLIGFLSLLFVAIGGLLYVLGGTAGGNEKMTTAGKLCVTGALIGLAIAAAGPAFLKQINLIVFGTPSAPALTGIENAPTLIQIVQRTLTFVLSIIGILAIIGLTISGTLYLLSGAGNQTEKAKSAMTASLIGIAIAAGALVLVSQVAKFFQ